MADLDKFLEACYNTAVKRSKPQFSQFILRRETQYTTQQAPRKVMLCASEGLIIKISLCFLIEIRNHKVSPFLFAANMVGISQAGL